MEPTQAQMVFCTAEQWRGGLFFGVEPVGDSLRLNPAGDMTGVVCLKVVDAGEKGFLWGRVQVEAELPPDTALRIYAHASDVRRWDSRESLQSELPPEDPIGGLRRLFGSPAAESGDCILQVSGRYLWLMLELTSAGSEVPTVSKLRLWMGGDHMVDYLPAIYQGDDFTYRFLSIFNSMFADMERQIDTLPSRLDYENTDREMLRYLASWVCVERGETDDWLTSRIRSALPDYETLYTVEGVRNSIRRLAGREPILLEHFQVSPNRPDCRDPVLYRRLYGEDPYRFFVLLPEDTFASQKAREDFRRAMEERIPAGMTMQMVQLKQCVQLDWHTYLGINSRVGGYVPAAIDEQSMIHYDTTIGGDEA